MSDKFIVCGLGGSALAAGLWKVARPELDLLIHRDYGLPRVPEYFLKESLIILSSYSGNTAEVLDTAKLALEAKLNLAVITSGGKLLDWAKNYNPPDGRAGIKCVVIPSGFQPRLALRPACEALGALINDANLGASSDTTIQNHEALASKLAANNSAKIPLIYSSTRNFPLAYHWKISLNETGKIPAFANALPEMNHNELESFTADPELIKKFLVIFLQDEQTDDIRITKRFEVLEKLLREKGVEIEKVNLNINSDNIWDKIWYSVKSAEKVASNLAKLDNRNPEEVGLIEEFKKLMTG